MSGVGIKGKASRAFPALTHRNFRYFWFGQCVSLIGTWMQRTAQQWLVYTITKSALLLGLLGAAQFGPMLIFSLFAGVLADRYPKKYVLIFTQTALTVQALILALLVWAGRIHYWEVLLLASIQGLVTTLDNPTRQSFFIELVGRKDLTNAIALNSGIVNTARIIGPAVAAIAMAAVGPGFCFLLNGISFVPVIVGLYLIHPEITNQAKKSIHMLKSVAEGLKYIFSKPILVYAVVAVLAVGTFAMNTNVLFPVFADQVLHRGIDGYGFLLSAMGIGSLAGAVLVAAKARQNPSRQTMFLSGLIIAALMVVAFFVRRLALAALDVGGIGFFNIIFMNTVNSTLQLNSGDEYHGRIMSVYSLALGGTTPIGNLFAGGFVQSFGPSVGFLMCGLITGVVLVGIVGQIWLGQRKSPAGHSPL